MGTRMEEASFAEAVWGMRESLLRFAMSILHSRADAEDAVSEATLRAWERLSTLRDASLFRRWMMTIVANCYYQHLRGAKRVVLQEEVTEGSQPAGDDRFALWACVRELPDGLREPIVLYYYEGFHVDEIAQILGVPRGTVAARMHRARTRLRAALAEKGEWIE